MCKHRAFALNRQHRYSQLMFSLSGATPANRALYERASGKSNMAIHLSRPASIVPVRACACSYYNGPKLCVTLFHFLPFKSCFLGRAPASPPIRTSTYATDAVRGVGSDEVWAGTITMAKNILVNSVICVLKVWKSAFAANVVELLNNMFTVFYLFS